MKRRTLLAAGAATAALPLTGCASTSHGLEVVCAWGGPELAAFRKVLAGFTAEFGHSVRIVVANGNGVDAMLSARLAADNRPDVAVLSEPSLITEYANAGHLVELPDRKYGANLPDYWRTLAGVDGTLYGCWVKIAHKSLFWYRQSALFPAADGDPLIQQPPQTWAEFVDLVKRWPVRGQSPLAIGAADGWVLTDWFENVLASLNSNDQTGNAYDALVSPQADWDVDIVRHALRNLGELWSLPNTLPYGGARALLTPFDASVAQVFGEHRAGMLFEGDFVAPIVSDLHSADEPSCFPFPPVEGRRRPQIVAGDVAVLLRRSTAGLDLMEYLTTKAAATPWADAGFLVAPYQQNLTVEYPQARMRQLAGEISDPTAEVRFDLSDQLTGKLIGDDGKGSWLILSDFFRAVTGGAPVGRAVDEAVRQFDLATGRPR
ncbi:sugar ABC transporter substrate-binding protein [Actinocatenispora thailandica]|uniref:Sugar ABC transporter substrate-binding protein n=1 Tax=Actinocatenispora thailandica TaxID=227318 RepID=A0A7R7DKV3_9ACTN|nr:ABC transporter substrate-binding protein [Actinocatenispora thailandica]BCJ33599.1 sugar ABC transporter substrate-binding protein [Actinocatenispora thailandica]